LNIAFAQSELKAVNHSEKLVFFNGVLTINVLVSQNLTKLLELAQLNAGSYFLQYFVKILKQPFALEKRVGLFSVLEFFNKLQIAVFTILIRHKEVA